MTEKRISRYDFVAGRASIVALETNSWRLLGAGWTKWITVHWDPKADELVMEYE